MDGARASSVACMERCAECGFDPETIDPSNAADTIRGLGRKWQAPLTRFLPGEDGATLVRTRPAPTTWSPLEYGAHVRDVFALFERRVDAIVNTDHPALEVVDHDDAVTTGQYRALDPPAVAHDIATTADTLANAFEKLTAADWSRSGTRDGEERTVLDVARRAVHEASHHLLDAGRGMRAARGR